VGIKKGCHPQRRDDTRGLLGLDLIFHAIAFPFDEDGFGMMQETVEKRWGQRTVIIEDLRPLLEDPVRSQDDGATFVTLADDLEQEIGAGFVDW
jgi:hypothetical protein